MAALLLSLLAGSIALLSIASLEPGYATMRFRAVRAIERHRVQIAMFGIGLLVCTGVLFILTKLPS